MSDYRTYCAAILRLSTAFGRWPTVIILSVEVVGDGIVDNVVMMMMIGKEVMMVSSEMTVVW